MNHVEIMQHLSLKWKSLSAKEHKIYEKQAEIDKQRYQQDLILFNQEFQKVDNCKNEANNEVAVEKDIKFILFNLPVSN